MPPPPSYGDRLTAFGIRLGPARRRGRMTIAPIFRVGRPRLRYLSLVRGTTLGAQIHESGRHRSRVGASMIPSQPILGYCGEILVGGWRDRVLDHSQLLRPPAAECEVVATSNGHGTSDDPTLQPSGLVAPPSVRRDLGGRDDQLADLAAMMVQAREVWGPLRGMFPCARNQCGAAVAIDGVAMVVDIVSRPSVFQDLYPSLLAGYCMDATNALGASVTDIDLTRLVAVAAAVPDCEDGYFRFDEGGLIQCGLRFGSRVVHTSVHVRQGPPVPRICGPELTQESVAVPRPAEQQRNHRGKTGQALGSHLGSRPG